MALSKIKVSRWYGIFVAAVFAAIAASVMFGLDTILNGISIVFAAGLTLVGLGAIGVGIAILSWFTIRDGREEIQSCRDANKAWIWQIFAYVALIGIFIDGLVGAWGVFQAHIMFSTAVRAIPFAGVPVLIAVAIYPIKWVEQLLRWRFARPRNSPTIVPTGSSSIPRGPRD